MRRKRIALAVGRRARHYSLELPRTAHLFTEDVGAGVRVAAAMKPDNIVVALDEAGSVLRSVEALRAAAPQTNLIVVAPELDVANAAVVVSAGADYCVQSWMAVTAGRLLRVADPRSGLRLERSAAL